MQFLLFLQEFVTHFCSKSQMADQNPSPSSSASIAAVERLHRRHPLEEDVGDPVACTGKSCQSCTAGVIADCVAVCCCPCAVVNILTLALVKLPWAVARKCLGRRKRKSRRRMLEEEKRKYGEGDRDGISVIGRVEEGSSGIVLSCEELNDHFSAEFKADHDVWLELYEVGHLGFGRVSFSGIPSQAKGD